jgi:hypothetical protein
VSHGTEPTSQLWKTAPQDSVLEETMRRHLWLLAGLLTVAACSNRPERRVTAAREDSLLGDLTLPDTVVHQDTAAAQARADQPVSPAEQQVASRESTPTRARKPVPKRSKPVPRVAARPAPDTSVRAYAPVPPSDTSAAVPAKRIHSDTIPADTTDTMGTATSDRVRGAPDTAVALPDSVKRPDSLRVATDTTGAPSPDTTSTSTADTAPTAIPDTRDAPSPASSANLTARTLAVGTEIHAALDDSITSRRDTVGHQVSAHVMENVVGPDGRTLIAAGTPVRLSISRLRPSRSKNSQGRLALQADGIALKGQLQPVKAELKPVPRELRGRGVTGSDAAKVGGGAAAGAVLGKVIGGNTKGAVIGGVAGAAAGAAVASQTATRDVVVKAKTPLVMVLTAPLVVP